MHSTAIHKCCDIRNTKLGEGFINSLACRKYFHSAGELVAAIARQMTPEIGRHQMIGQGEPNEETSSPTPTGGRKMSIDERLALMKERKASEEISQASKSELMSVFVRRSQSPSVGGKRREGGRE